MDETNPPIPKEVTRDTIKRLHDRLDKQDDVLRAIHGALVGDEKLGHKGLVVRVQEVETKQEDQGKKLLVWGGIVTGLTTAIGMAKDWLK